MSALPTYHTLSNKMGFRLAVLIIVLMPFVGLLLAIFLLWERAVGWPDLVLLLSAYTLNTLGLTIGYHRMLTHRSFRAHPVPKAIFLILGSMSVQAPALEWAATHVKHHARADREGDPHSPLDGLFHAHLGWIFGGFADPSVYCRHLLKDRMVLLMSRTFLVWVALSLAIPFALGGWRGLVWGGLVRIFLLQHVTFSVNSICHLFGKREFATNDESHNEWVIGLLALGEGWHNNHHAFPRSAFHGLHWWQVDLSGYIIWLLERLGLAKDVYRVSPAQRQRLSARRGGALATAPEPEHPVL